MRQSCGRAMAVLVEQASRERSLSISAKVRGRKVVLILTVVGVSQCESVSKWDWD